MRPPVPPEAVTDVAEAIDRVLASEYDPSRPDAIARAAYEAAAPHITAQATAAERERIRQLAIDHERLFVPTWVRSFADLLEGTP